MKLFALITLFLLMIPFVHATYIAEIMYNPPGNDNNKEYIELSTSTPLNLTNWTLKDTTSNDTITLLREGDPTCIVFLIVEQDYNGTHSCPVYTTGATLGNGLNNDKDTITIYDDLGNLITTVNYNNTYGNDNGYAVCYTPDNIAYECTPTPGENNQQPTPPTSTNDQENITQEEETPPQTENEEKEEEIILGREPQLKILRINNEPTINKFTIQDSLTIEIYLYSGERIGDAHLTIPELNTEINITMDDTFSEFRINLPLTIPRLCNTTIYTLTLSGFELTEERKISLTPQKPCAEQHTSTTHTLFNTPSESHINQETRTLESTIPDYTSTEQDTVYTSTGEFTRRISTYLFWFVILLTGYYIIAVR